MCAWFSVSTPASKMDVLSRSKPRVPKLACQVVRFHSCSICNKLSRPEGACGDLGASVQGSGCLFPPCSLPLQWQWCWIPASPLVCWGIQLGIVGQRSKGENYFWCRFPQGKAVFLGAGTQQRGPCNCVSKNGPSASFLCHRAVAAWYGSSPRSSFNALKNWWSCNIRDSECNWERNPSSRIFFFFLWLFLGHVVFPHLKASFFS